MASINYDIPQITDLACRHLLDYFAICTPPMESKALFILESLYRNGFYKLHKLFLSLFMAPSKETTDRRPPPIITEETPFLKDAPFKKPSFYDSHPRKIFLDYMAQN